MEYLNDVRMIFSKIFAMNMLRDEPAYFYMKNLSAFFIACITCLFGGIESELLTSIFILIGIDWILGLYIAIIFKKLRSRTMVKGAIKILIYMILILIGNRILVAKMVNLSVACLVCGLITTYILLTEAISICENLLIISSYYDIKMPVIDVLIRFLDLQEKNLFKQIFLEVNKKSKKKKIEEEKKPE